MLVFVMMGIDIDDQKLVELPLMGLPCRVRQQLAGVEVLDADAPVAIGKELHQSPLSLSSLLAVIARPAPPQALQQAITEFAARRHGRGRGSDRKNPKA